MRNWSPVLEVGDKRWRIRTLMGLGLVIVAGLGGGCAGSAVPVGVWSGPGELTAVEVKPWNFRGTPGLILESTNYRLHTTLPNRVTAQRAIQLLEGGLLEYRKITPHATLKRPGLMNAYLFANRSEWAAFTQQKTGASAKLYLQITRGGYAINGLFVAYYTADLDTWSVTAHEGFHQFCQNYLTGRLPPFLEEGLSTTFERVKFDGAGRPRFNPLVNPLRAQELRTVMEARAMYPLTTLYQLDAGQIVGGPGIRIQAFYAQSWAFARFVREYEHGKYLLKFEAMADATADGSLFDPTGFHRVAQPNWDRKAVQPILEHYLGASTATIQKEYDDWCRYLAYEEFPRQWASQ